MKEAKFSKKEIPPHACLWTGFRKNDVFPAAITACKQDPEWQKDAAPYLKEKRLIKEPLFFY